MRNNQTLRHIDERFAKPTFIESIRRSAARRRGGHDNEHESPASSGPARILIAGASGQLRRRVREMFTNERGFCVVGEVAQAYELTAFCGALSPDVLLLGLDERGDTGYALAALAVLKQTVRVGPFRGTVVLVDGDSAEDVIAAITAGAQGIVRRDVSKNTLLETVNRVMAGDAPLDPHLNEMIFSYLANVARLVSGDGLTATIGPAVRQMLSPREQEVFFSLARGCHNDEIATQMGVSVGTVKTHLRHIYRKLGVKDRMNAVLTAYRLHLSDAA